MYFLTYLFNFSTLDCHMFNPSQMLSLYPNEKVFHLYIQKSITGTWPGILHTSNEKLISVQHAHNKISLKLSYIVQVTSNILLTRKFPTCHVNAKTLYSSKQSLLQQS
jgi:hypothetical protein